MFEPAPLPAAVAHDYAQGICPTRSNCRPKCPQKCAAQFRQNIGRHRPELWATARWFLLHDNVHFTLPLTNFCRCIKLAYYCMCHILQGCHLANFPYSHDWKEHYKAIVMLTLRPFGWTWRKNSAAFRKSVAQDCFKDLKKCFNDVRRTYF